VGGLNVGLAVGVAVGVAVDEGVTVGARVDVIVMKVVGVTVAVGMLPPLTLPVIHEISIARDTKPTITRAALSRRSTRSLAIPPQGSNMVLSAVSASRVLPAPEGTMPLVFTIAGGKPNSDWCISAML